MIVRRSLLEEPIATNYTNGSERSSSRSSSVIGSGLIAGCVVSISYKHFLYLFLPQVQSLELEVNTLEKISEHTKKPEKKKKRRSKGSEKSRKIKDLVGPLSPPIMKEDGPKQEQHPGNPSASPGLSKPVTAERPPRRKKSPSHANSVAMSGGDGSHLSPGKAALQRKLSSSMENCSAVLQEDMEREFANEVGHIMLAAHQQQMQRAFGDKYDPSLHGQMPMMTSSAPSLRDSAPIQSMAGMSARDGHHPPVSAGMPPLLPSCMSLISPLEIKHPALYRFMPAAQISKVLNSSLDTGEPPLSPQNVTLYPSAGQAPDSKQDQIVTTKRESSTPSSITGNLPLGLKGSRDADSRCSSDTSSSKEELSKISAPDKTTTPPLAPSTSSKKSETKSKRSRKRPAAASADQGAPSKIATDAAKSSQGQAGGAMTEAQDILTMVTNVNQPLKISAIPSPEGTTPTQPDKEGKTAPQVDNLGERNFPVFISVA